MAGMEEIEIHSKVGSLAPALRIPFVKILIIIRTILYVGSIQNQNIQSRGLYNLIKSPSILEYSNIQDNSRPRHTPLKMLYHHPH